MQNELKNVVDSFGNSYSIKELIGEGSQGRTYLLEDGIHIAKLFKKNLTIPAQRIKSQINFLIRLELDKSKYSIPLREISQPMSGYISEFASGMCPISDLQIDNKPEDEDQLSWFKRTGGLLKRYGVLIKLASELRSLHAKGLIYCDLSDNNVFISENPQKCNVYLIDLDNLRYKTSIVNNIYTPGYGAPEVVNCTAPNSTHSDEFSFAVMAYKILTWAHPLIGDYVHDGEAELEEQAYQGKLPWCEDDANDINHRNCYGIPSSLFVSQKIMKLFRKTFEKGLNEPSARPSMGEWIEALNNSLNELLLCPQCGIHYLYFSQGECPFCERKSLSAITLKVKRWDKILSYDKETNSIKDEFALSDKIYEEIIVDEDTPKSIKAYHLNLETENHIDDIVGNISATPDCSDILLKIQPKNDYTFFLRIVGSEEDVEVDKPRTIRVRPNKTKELMIGGNYFSKGQTVITI